MEIFSASSMGIGSPMRYFISVRLVVSDPDSPSSHEENKKKIIKTGLLLRKEMALISVSIKMPFLWTI